jgi:hypothetical protein
VWQAAFEEALHNWYSSLIVIRVIKSRRVRFIGLIKCMGEMRRSYSPCGGGLKYLHHDPASRRRRWKGKSQIWGTKIRLLVPRDSDPRKTTWRGPAAYTKDRPPLLVTEGTLQKQDRNCQRVINIWSWAPDGAWHQDLLIDWLSVAMWLLEDLTEF